MDWDEEADVVVLGFGAAGSATAIAAADAGASVIVIEWQAEEAHTPSIRMSGGLVMTVNDVDRASAYLDLCAAGLTPPGVNRAWATRAADLREWLERSCPELTWTRYGGGEHPAFDGADAIDVVRPAGRGVAGSELFESIGGAVRRRGVPVKWNSRARRLVGESGRVDGVLVETERELRRVRARYGVVLATGGFEFDDELKANHLPIQPMYFYGNPGNAGDGLRLAQAAGAALWHMNVVVGRGVLHFDGPGPHGLTFQALLGRNGYVVTDQAGQRFMNEHEQAALGHTVNFSLMGYDSATREYPRIPAYWFFDEARRRAGPLVPRVTGLVGVGLSTWSHDNAAEIERGWIARGRTIAEAGHAAGMTDEGAAAAERTVHDFNGRCGAGAPDPLGRPSSTLQPLDQPPYYCVPLWPGGANTSGGPRRDAHARVLDPFGEPVVGLYAAGELGQVAGLLYPAYGANLSDAFCFGQIAVDHIVDSTR